MSHLNLDIPKYDRNLDPIFFHATKLHPLEEHTIASQLLVSGPQQIKCEPPEIKQELDEIKQEQLDDIKVYFCPT